MLVEMLNEIKPPLLSLYLCYSDNIPIKIYKEVLTNFEELWGMHLHVLSQNVRNNANINKFMELVKKNTLKILKSIIKHILLEKE